MCIGLFPPPLSKNIRFRIYVLVLDLKTLDDVVKPSTFKNIGNNFAYRILIFYDGGYDSSARLTNCISC